MSLAQKQAQTKALVKKTLEEIGFNLPERERIKATKTTSVRIEPQGALRVTHAIDTFVDGEVMKWKNNLSGKKLVLFFAKESNYLSREFLTPKMSVIYQSIIAERDDVEFLFVGLMKGQTKVEYNRFAKRMRKLFVECSLRLLEFPFCIFSWNNLVDSFLHFLRTAWPSIPNENTTARQLLIDTFYTKLKKKYDAAAIVVLDEDHEKILCIDAEPKLSATHDDTGKDFPWKVSVGENALGVGAAVAFPLWACTIS